jgi:hypothetical protein
MASKWPTFVATGKDLETAFDNAVGYFNNQQAANLQNALNANVVLKKVGHPNPNDLVLGAANVMQYIQLEWRTDNPKFHPHGASKHVDPVLGSVHGLAEWDETPPGQGPVKDQIRYFFLFDQTAAGVWEIIFLWGSQAL